MKKRVLSLLMALTLCLTTLPTAVFADVTENGEGSGGTHYVAESGGTQYETVQEILENMEEGEITLLDSVTEDLTVYAATTIHMNGHSITGNIDATDSLTLNGGTVDGTVKVGGGTLNMTAPAEAEAAITGGLNVVSGSASVSGAKVGVKGTLYFDGKDMLISGAVKAVELDSAAEPAAKTLYGSATVNGDTAAEAGFDTDTYKVGGEIAKKLTNKPVGSTTPAAPSLTLTETSKSLTAGKTAVFTANYTGTDTLNAYVQGSAVNGCFTISQKNNGDGTYTVSVKIDEETPGGTYTLFVHEVGNTSVQASATITVIGLPDAAEVNGKQYKSLPRALNAARDGDTVKLLANHVTDADALNALGEDFTFKQYASIVPVVTKTLTLDLNHKTVDYLEVGFSETNEETQKKETLATGNLTVTGEAAYGRISNLMFMAGALDIRSGEIGGPGCAGLFCDANSGSVTVSNGTVYGLTVLEGASVTVNGGSKHAGEWVVASGATLNITDGTFGEVQFTHNGTIAISGGTFKSIKSYIAEELQPLMSLLADNYAFYQGDNAQNSTEKTLTDVTVKPHTHTIVNGKCSVCGEVEGDGCIAHAVWSPYADYPQWRTTHIKTMDELREKITSPSTKWLDFDNNATVTFLCDVTVDKTFLIDSYYTNIIIDLNGHTLSGALDDPIITANFVSGTGTIDFKNGKIVNTGSGEAIRLAKGKVTLENVDVTGNLSFTHDFVNSRSYIPTFLGGGSFTKICTVNDAGGWQKVLEDMLPKGYYFADITSGKRASQTVLKADSPLENVTVKPCNHKDADGKSTFTYKPERQTYYYCSICGNICPHEHRTELADGSLHCEDCNLTLTAARRDSKNTITYYIDMSDAFGNAYQPIIWPLCDQTCTQAAMTYYGSNTIDLNGFTVTASNSSGVLFAPYVSYSKMTLQNSAVNQGQYVCEYLQVYNDGTLAIPAENNNLTISAVLIKSDGNANLAGGSFGKISVEGKKTLAGLLVSGYYFADTASGEPAAMYDADGTALTELTNVTVQPCSHDTAVCGSDGVWKCLCGQNVFVASVTKDGTPTYYTDLQNAFSAADGNTVKLLANAGEITIGSPLKLNLNGKTAAKLTVTGDVTLASLLPEGYTFKSGSTWISDPIGTELTNVSMAKIPIKSMDYPTEMSMTYGGAGTLLVNVKKETGTGAVSFQWYKVEDGKATAVGSATAKNQFDLAAQNLSAGQHTFRFSATCDGYKKMSRDIAVTVQRANISASLITPPIAQENLTYTGQEQALITAGSVANYGTMQYSLTENGTYSQDIPTGTDAGTYTVWYRVIGDANHNNTAPASVAVSIRKKPLTITGVTAASKPYDGTTDAGIPSVTFDNVTLNRGTDYTVTASFDDASVGNGKNVTATVTLMGQAAKNYALEQSSFTTTGSITKAAAPDFTKETALVIVNGHEKTYTVTLPTLPTLETPKEYGTVTYGAPTVNLSSTYYADGAKVEDGNLILPIQKNDVKTTGSVGTVTVVIKSTNYEDITLTVNVNATNKLVPTGAPTLSKTTLAWGEQLSTITLSGTMTDPTDSGKTVTGKFEWIAPNTKMETVGDYQAEWKFTPTDTAVYAETTGNVTIKVIKATPTGAPTYTKITTGGKTLKDANLTVGTIQPEGAIQWEQGDKTVVTANTAYKWVFIPNDDAHYNELTGSITPYSVSNSSGGGGSSSSDRDNSGSTGKTETTTKPDGTKVETVTKPDGTTIKTETKKDGSVSKTETRKDGSSVTETKAADGSTGTVKTDKHGQTTAETKMSSKAIETAKRNGEPVTAPVEVEATRNSDTAPTVKIELPRNSGDTKVEIPVSNVKPGTVAVLVHPDGTEEIVKNSLPTEDGIQLTVNGGATVKIVDNAKDFIDTRAHWAKDAIDFVSARGLVNGMNAVAYAPNASTTRAQLWTILARQNDADLSGGATWFENAQNWAKAKGISDGANPNGTINRAQMVTMLWRAMGQPAAGSNASFADVPADSYYAQAVAWAIENGITAGVGGGRFDPTATCTRAQIAAFLARSMK